MKVTLREKKLKDNKISLYLDFYPPIIKPDTGKPTRREFLGLYIYSKPKTETERQHNKETKLLAENVCAKRQLAIQAENYGFLVKSHKQSDFLAYFHNIVEKRQESKKSVWDNAYKHFSDFCGGECTFGQVNRDIVENFKTYLLTCESRRSTQRKLSQNSANAYFTCFLAVIKEAVQDNLFTDNPAAKVKNIQMVKTLPEFLTLEELQKLAQTECKIPDTLRRGALFSALTGLRFSDIKHLKWENLYHSEEGYTLRFKIKKTGENLSLPISDDAHELLGEKGAPSALIFHNLDFGSMLSVHLGRWALAAGITRKITFHCFRHTFATGLLTEGTDLYTVSKMLGHTNVKHTQIYARVIDKKKREAANKIKLK